MLNQCPICDSDLYLAFTSPRGETDALGFKVFKCKKSSHYSITKWNSAREILTRKMIISPYLVYLDYDNFLIISKELTEEYITGINSSSIEVFYSLNNLEAVQNFLLLK